MTSPAPRPSPWVTTSTVLQRLQHFDDRDAWSAFSERFRRPIAAYARRRGLSDADAEDAAQETLAAFADAYRRGAYDKTRGRLSQWLFGFARNKVERAFEAAHKHGGDVRASELASGLAGGDAVDPEWEEAWERAMLEQCLASARGEFAGSTWRVFEMLVLENRSVDETAAETGLSRNAVYIAKHRVLGRVQELLRDCDEVT
jgi:RNA polymerase sigma-70 factor (ECF subfamily)